VACAVGATMGVTGCTAGRPVRVLSGADTGDLGVLVFQGQLDIANGMLAVVADRNPAHQLLFGSPVRVALSVFGDNVVEVIHFDEPTGGYPVSGPSDR
jgi:hypothetical protein